MWSFPGEAVDECLDRERRSASTDARDVVPVLKHGGHLPIDCKCSPGHLPLAPEVREGERGPLLKLLAL